MRSGHLKEFVLKPRGQETGQNARPLGNPLPPSLGVIEVIHATSRDTLVTQRKGVLNHGAGRGLSRRTTVAEEGEICPGTHCFQ